MRTAISSISAAGLDVDVVSDDDLAGLDEFGLLHENAEQIGVSGPLPSVQRVESGPISAIKWGDEPPQVVFLHGGGQSPHLGHRDRRARSARAGR